jgi:NTE family protein
MGTRLAMHTAQTPAPRVGLVLGAGGTTGAAFHAGTLLALEQDLGWDPRTADLIVGSSAGSIVGALLRTGLSADDLAAWGASAVASPSGRVSRLLLDELEAVGYRITPSSLRVRLPSAGMIRRALRPSQLKMHTAVMSLLPQGWINAGESLQRLGTLREGWPQERLWITAVRVADARRVVFGREDHRATLGQAIAASCAIPAFFRPVEIGRHRYIDGGAHSPTNADLLIDAGVDVAVVLSPMSARADALRRRPDHVLRSLFSRRLAVECQTLRNAGIEVHVFQPNAETLAVMGINALDRGRSPHVVRESFLGAGAHVSSSDTLRRALGTRVTARSHA